MLGVKPYSRILWLQIIGNIYTLINRYWQQNLYRDTLKAAFRNSKIQGFFLLSFLLVTWNHIFSSFKTSKCIHFLWLMLFMCKEEDKSHLNKSLGFQKLGPLNYDSTTSIRVSFGRSGSFRADLRSKALISSPDLKAGQVVLLIHCFSGPAPLLGMQPWAQRKVRSSLGYRRQKSNRCPGHEAGQWEPGSLGKWTWSKRKPLNFLWIVVSFLSPSFGYHHNSFPNTSFFCGGND